MTLWPWTVVIHGGHVINPSTKFEDLSIVELRVMVHDLCVGANFSYIFQISDTNLSVYFATYMALQWKQTQLSTRTIRPCVKGHTAYHSPHYLFSDNSWRHFFSVNPSPIFYYDIFVLTMHAFVVSLFEPWHWNAICQQVIKVTTYLESLISLCLYNFCAATMQIKGHLQGEIFTIKWFFSGKT